MQKNLHSVNDPAHRAGHLKKPDEGDCIPISPAPHSSPATGQDGVFCGRGIKYEIGIKEVTAWL